ncbi:hypothetical protein ACQP0C_34725 [Nocardia sp. CA-129566]|uniref:hypothetical protein n=1 Tax=Nocardia sp. CA-129566 TaxID=3239976 RepID=UPI003D9968FC
MQRRIAFVLVGFAALLTPVSAANATAGLPLTAADEAPATQQTTADTIGTPMETGSASGSSEILRCLAGQIPSCL